MFPVAAMDILIVFCIFGALAVVMLSLNRLLGPRRTNPAKEQPFECGSPPLETGLKPYSVQFYLVALVFLVFDVEVVFFFPWAVVFRRTIRTAGPVMIVYAAVLLIGFVYAWRTGAFRWE